MEEKKLIEFRDIVKNFDGQIVLRGSIWTFMRMNFVTLLGPSVAGRRHFCAFWEGFWTLTRERSFLMERRSVKSLPMREN